MSKRYCWWLLLFCRTGVFALLEPLPTLERLYMLVTPECSEVLWRRYIEPAK